MKTTMRDKILCIKELRGAVKFGICNLMEDCGAKEWQDAEVQYTSMFIDGKDRDGVMITVKLEFCLYEISMLNGIWVFHVKKTPEAGHRTTHFMETNSRREAKIFLRSIAEQINLMDY